MKLKDLLETYGEYDVVLSKREATNEIMIEGRKPKPKTVWDLKNGDRYFVVFLTGEIGDIKFTDCQNDCCVVSNGNAFFTKEEAEKDVERRKVETLLLKYGGRRWFKEDMPNHFIRVHENGLWFTSDWTNHSPIQGTIYFDSEKQAKEAINAIGEERIRNALFEVR